MMEPDDIDGPLSDIRHMAEIAAEIAERYPLALGAPEGYLLIHRSQHERLVFVCNEVVARAQELLKDIDKSVRSAEDAADEVTVDGVSIH